MSTENDITHLIERLDVFEERLKVRFAGLFAKASQEDWGAAVSVNGEVHPADGGGLGEDVEVVADILDRDGRLIERQTQQFSCETFFGFQSFHFYISAQNIQLNQIRTIRLYPQTWP